MSLIQSDRSWPVRLSALAFFLLAAVVPVLAIPVPRLLSVFIPLMGYLCLPLCWQMRAEINVRKLMLPLSVFAALLVLGYAQSPVPVRASHFILAALGVMAGCGALILASLRLSGNEPLRAKIFKVLTASWVVGIILVLIEYNFDKPLLRYLAQLQGHPVPELYTVDRGIVVLSFLFWPLMQHWRLGLVKVILLGVLGAVLLWPTSSQAAVAAYIIGLFVLPLMTVLPRFGYRALRLGVIILFLAMPFLLLGLYTALGTDANIWANANSGARLGIWMSGVVHLMSAPLLGNGIEAGSVLFGIQQNIHPHNAILQLWLEFGVVGVTLALLGVLRLLEFTKDRPLMQTAFIAWLLVICVSYDIWQCWWLATAGLLLTLQALTYSSHTAHIKKPER